MNRPAYTALCCACFAFAEARGRLRLGSAIESRLENNVVQSSSSTRGYTYAISQNKGLHRGEDMIVTSGSNEVYNISLLMDGHGGQDVVKHAGRYLQHTLLEHCSTGSAAASPAEESWPGCATRAFATYQKDVRRQSLRGGAVVVVVLVEIETSRVAFAWAGDAAALILDARGQVIFRTSSHTLDNKEELARIQAGRAQYSYEIDDGYLCHTNERVGCVEPTRGIGDLKFESAGFLPVPETSELMDLAADDMVIVASDGLWDVIEEHEVIRHVMLDRDLDFSSPPSDTRAALATKLVQNAIDEWRQQYDDSEADDVCLLMWEPAVASEFEQAGDGSQNDLELSWGSEL
eukprot:TRINITY_DN111504_c0_g1_i1.p1 TRINITY_DN111504_c0_g1~~TRINITY_DN111504_c0_g1_i1.p1  ORF type:complete len:348 (+),score=67.42 TRINITY_DN111504_c0_g1_i1:2-1045(+)